TGMSTGLVQSRENFLIPNDAYPRLQNAYVWRERILRKKGYQLLGRLQRNMTNVTRANANGTGTYTNTILNFVSGEPNSQLVPGTFIFTFDIGGPNETIYEDDGEGNITLVSGPYTISSGSINYFTSVLTLTFIVAPPGGTTSRATFSYNPSLP